MNKLLVLFAATFLILGAGLAANPEGATVTSQGNTTAAVDTAALATARGGYIQLLTVTGRTQTQVWGGFVGNVTGTLTLRDAAGWSLYNWTMLQSQGEIYAVASGATPTWASIACASAGNVGAENTAYNMGTRWDNMTQTVTGYTHPAFTTAGHSFTTDNCAYGLRTLVASGTSSMFNETLLNADGNTIIYTGHLVNKQTGYNNLGIYDFQMIVPEDAQGSAEATATNYYFYVELQ